MVVVVVEVEVEEVGMLVVEVGVIVDVVMVVVVVRINGRKCDGSGGGNNGTVGKRDSPIANSRSQRDGEFRTWYI